MNYGMNFLKEVTAQSIYNIQNKAEKVAVFEVFFDFLSFISLLSKNEIKESSFCVLNPLSFFEKSRAFLEKHGIVHLYLDDDTAGINKASYAKKLK